MGMLISNEPDFMIHGVLKYQMFGQDFWITTTTIGMWIVSILILIVAFLANRTLKKATDVPGAFQNALEYAFDMLDNMAKGILGSNASRFVNY
ncbi:MAG: F0F1 ATP synthase subunit A, partial [Lachnospiraceae bacterium]|nr:F0F1 ATP synthase subunit A [Lachnospiraceae bacterium]